MYLKRLKIDKYAIGAFCIILFALVLRIILIGQGWPQTNSDEGTIGLMALHIAYRGEHPAFFYGQGYMGPLEAYLAAILFQLFGPSLFTLRMGLIIILALFFVSMYLLTSLLYSKKLALITLSILSLGSIGELLLQLRAIGGYAETLLFGSLLILLAAWLGLSYQQQTPSSGRRLLRYAVYACWGYLVGLSIYSDLLIMPFVIMSTLFLLIICWPELDSWAPTCVTVSFTLGILPLLIYNINALPTQSSLFYFLLVYRSDTTGQAFKQVPLAEKIAGSLLVGLPNATGANPICSTQTLPYFGLYSSASFHCTLLQGSWSIACILLWLIAVLLTIRALWRHLRLPQIDVKPTELRWATVRYAARLMLLGSAALTLVLFTLSPVAGLDPLINSRYLICLLIATPAIIAPLLLDELIVGKNAGHPQRDTPIVANSGFSRATARVAPTIDAWTGVHRLVHNRNISLRVRWRPICQLRFFFLQLPLTAILIYICIMLVVGTIGVFNMLPSTQAFNKQQNDLIDNLLHLGANRIYSEYWTCDRIIFVSDERIICSVVDEDLQPGYNRYDPYYFIVKGADAHASYVLPLGSEEATNFVRRFAHSKRRFRRYIFDGYVIYQPA